MLYTFDHEKIEYCGQCPCYNDDGGGCMLGYLNGWLNIEHNDEKPEDCPLFEVE